MAKFESRFRRISLHRFHTFEWDFMRGEVGRSYEAIEWGTDQVTTTEEARKHFKGLSVDGNVPAYLCWIMENDPEGHSSTIPFEDSRLFRWSDGRLDYPFFSRQGQDRELRGAWIEDRRVAGHRCMAFREIK
ncbi:hypothetical protein IPH19_02960 [Candidatus Uhrbacteria bacterium]|nr:MAG: hypothetical protein IPH19_02960 [Candidatus Uhrbacteria bacterium]